MFNMHKPVAEAPRLVVHRAGVSPP